MKKINYIVIILLAFASCKEANYKQNQNNIVHVKVAEVIEQAVQFPIRSAGRLAAKSEQKLAFRTGGIIYRVHISGGEEVKKGQILAELNMREIQAQLNMALESYHKAERGFERVSNLYNDSVATLASLQDAKTALSVAQSNLDIAKFNMQYSKIAASSNGRILRVLVEENEIVAPGYPVMIFGSTHKQWVVKVNLSDKDMVLVNLGDSASLNFDPFPNEIFEGRVSEIAGMADPYTGLYEVEITLNNNKGKRLSSGMIVRVEIIPPKEEILIALPMDAVFSIVERKGYVYVIKDSIVEKRKIYIERIADPFVFVSGDVNSGDWVVSEGAGFISADSKIKIK